MIPYPMAELMDRMPKASPRRFPPNHRRSRVTTGVHMAAAPIPAEKKARQA